jgi:aminoglycoside phosphotransferase (APT) family kinase protein
MSDEINEEILLQAVRDGIAFDIASTDLPPTARAAASAAISVLDRLIADRTFGATDAALRSDRWHALAKLVPGASGSPSTPIGHVEDAAELERRVLRELEEIVRAGSGRLVQGLNDGTSPATAWFADAVAAVTELARADDERRRAASAARPTTTTTAAAPGSPSGGAAVPLSDTLSRYLRSRLPALPPDVVLRHEPVTGGRGKETALLVLRPNDVLPERVVLRRDVPPSNTQTTVVAEFPVLDELHRRGLAVPRPLLYEGDTSVLGGTFLLMEEVVGTVGPNPVVAGPEHALTERSSPALGGQIARTMARLHAVGELPTMPGLPPLNALSPDPAAVVADYKERWRLLVKPPKALIVDLAFLWLETHPLPADRPRGLVHGDFGSHNLVLDDHGLVAVLDWELAHLGDPAEDIGYSRQMLLDGIVGWDDFVREYVDAGGDPRACDAGAVSFFSVWAGLRNAVHIATKYDWLVTGQRRDLPTVTSAVHVFRTNTHFLARDLTAAFSGN